VEGPSFETTYPAPVGLEIKDGFAVAIDGGGLVIGDSAERGTWTLSNRGNVEYTITRDDKGTHIQGSSPGDGIDLLRDGQNLHVRSAHSNQNADVTVQDGHIDYQGTNFNHTHITADLGVDGAIIHGGKFSTKGTTSVQVGANAVSVTPDAAARSGAATFKKDGDHIQVGALTNPQIALTSDGFVITTDIGMQFDIRKTA
jgi:hypothetical protein